MEKRIGNVIIQTPGGTASKNSSTYKVSLPSAWIKEMGITDSDRQIELTFDGTAITISKKLSLDEFISSGRSEGHKIYLLSYYDDQTLCSKIAADYTSKTLCFDISSVPWIEFTSFNLNVFTPGTHLPPIFTTGKLIKENGKVQIPVSLQVHHSVCDGFHAGQCFTYSQKLAHESGNWM